MVRTGRLRRHCPGDQQSAGGVLYPSVAYTRNALMRIKQSICYPLFKPADMSLETLVKTAADIGYAAVELWARPPEFEEIMALARRYGLAVASMSGHMSLPDG